MSQNILVTGGAGYIGGSVVAELLSRTSSSIKGATVFATVRSEEQVQRLSKHGIGAIQLDLHNETAAMEAVIRNEIDIIIHTASSAVPSHVSNLVKALGRRRQVGGKETYFIHSSILTMFGEDGGWPSGEVRDTDPLFEKEKQLGTDHPGRATDIAVVEQAKAEGVVTFLVMVPTVYGKGSGQGRRLSVNIPAYVRTSIKLGIVYKFDKDGNPPATHISDLTALYALLVEKILQKEPIPSGEKGYYFAMAHRISWWAIMPRLAEGLHMRGLVTEPRAQTWPSYDMASEYLRWPPQFVRAMGTSSGQQIPINAYQIGWQPKWDEQRFLEGMDDEIKAALESDTVPATLFDKLLSPSKGSTGA
ncbi:uncharacterized protein B0I36DRAFT_277426 [Microdochium trichocladiopsis]|uniref:NAD-dependent epimerase/dehydratase domain-containing protein n=1 Tax=Microdochium trichocladiopsis TaxID=1682393 RepID=A0A9P9BIX8_9PEZI|nr:uncharacterized protein B0I36DRAFT_277426 [Microdochium trichocladiopsis]KAH7016148.1 hypothetical protein B0I36DRAFT_277426 [Microdochium trichocladiopsis]